MMKFQGYISALAAALSLKNAEQLAYLLSPDMTNGQKRQMVMSVDDCSRESMQRFKGAIMAPWDDIAIAHVQVIVNIMDNNYSEAYREQAVLANHFFRAFTKQDWWILPTVHAVLSALRSLASKADEVAKDPTDALEDVARVCQKAFSVCLNDRENPITSSRKWGAYHSAGMALKCYFKADRISLSKNVVRAIAATADLPPFEHYPRADQVTYKYYIGLIAFLNEDYEDAEKDMEFTFDNCHRSSYRNQELALTYLIPMKLLHGKLPSAQLLDRFPRLQEVYTPFVNAMRTGSIKEYDAALAWAEPRLMSTGVWLCVEKAREICMRGLLKKTWRVLGKSTRMHISAFHMALQLSAVHVPVEEAEGIIAAVIYKGHAKGYISHEKQTVVWSSKSTFPKLG